MKPPLIILGFMLLLTLVPTSLRAAEPAPPGDASALRGIHTTLERYCGDCHGDPDWGPEAGLSLTRDFASLPLKQTGSDLKKALHATEGFEMPPADAEQPSHKERQQLVDGLRKILAQPQFNGKRDPGRPIIRRLTRLEYNNTVRDLLGLDTDVFMFSERLPFDREHYQPAARKLDPTLKINVREYGGRYPVFLRDASLPGDSRAEHGFTNRGDVQNLSASQFEQYLELARGIAFHPELLWRGERMKELFPKADAARPQPVAQPSSPAIATTSAAIGTNGNVARTAKGSHLTLEIFREELQEAFKEDRGGVFDADEIGNRVIAGKGGRLKLAYGTNGQRVVAINPNEDLWIASFGTAEASSGKMLFTNKQRGKTTFELTFEATGDERFPGVVRCGMVVLSRKGQSGRLTITAKMDDDSAKSLTVDLAEGPGKDNTFVALAAPAGRHIRRIAIDGSELSGEFALLDDLAFITADAPSEQQIVGREIVQYDEQTEKRPKRESEPSLNLSLAGQPPQERIAHFMRRAFRRGVSPEEVRVYERLYQAEVAGGGDDETGMRAAIQAILSSPSFLYISEIPEVSQDDNQPIRLLTDYEIASRLSYFLWSSMPDDELLHLADAGKLRDAGVLEQQTQRLLADPRSVELTENFFVQWLHLRELWSAQPDRAAFSEYYSGPMGKRTMARDMFGEILLLTQMLVVENRSVLELLDPESSYVNGPLIKLYNLKPESVDLVARGNSLTDEDLKDDAAWHRIVWPNDGPQAVRGGVLTSAGTLTMTSFPHRTSPIRRGAWFLETIYNRPPPPPNVAVAEIDDQKDLEKLTRRKQVEKHRENAACAVCHNRMDPPGFALETFDPIGRWRTTDGEETIDSSGELAGLGKFSGSEEFRTQLVQEKQRFVCGFTEHLLSYALARKLTYADVATVDEIIDSVAADNYRFNDLIVAIVLSDSFRYTRTEP